MVCVDRLSKMVHFAPTHNTLNAEECAYLFYNTVIRLHGWPGNIVSDRDPIFTSAFFKELCALTGTKQHMSSAFHPQSDGQTERANRTLEEILRHYVAPAQDDWDKILAAAEFAINNAWHPSIDSIPFMLNHGQHPRTPFDIPLTRHVPGGGRVPAAQRFHGSMSEHLARAKDALRAAQSRQAKYANQSRRDMRYQIGDEVFLSTKHLALKVPRDGTPKLMPKWTGPFAVSEVVNEVAYRLQLPANLKIHDVFHVSLLKPFLSDGRYQAPPPPISVDGELEYELECILNHRDHRVGRGSYRQYLVSWVNQGAHGNTWEFESDLTNCEEELRRYWHSQGWTSGATSPWSARGTQTPSPRTRSGTDRNTAACLTYISLPKVPKFWLLS